MEEQKLLQTFAVNKDGELVSIRDVPSGLECGCFCPGCGEVLIAKKGEVRAWHFAHESGAACAGAAEGAIHLAAKHVLAKQKCVLIPALEASAIHKMSDGRVGRAVRSVPECMAELEDVRLEVTVGTIRPDVVATVASQELFIEIAVTHLVDEQKLSVIKSMMTPVLEIELDPQRLTSWTWEDLAALVINEPGNRKWVYHPELRNLQNQADDQARLNASQQNVPERHEETRLKLRGTFIKVVNRGWGVTVWSPYHEEVNAIVKTIARPLGGQWQPKYKSWKLPPGVGEVFLSQLKDFGAVEEG